MTPDPARDALLRAYDLALLAPAAKYNLDRRPHRRQSAADLVELFFALATALDPDLFVEAGAKDATASRRARALFPDATVLAFEANPYTYRRFAAANAAAGVDYRHLALTDRPGPVTFHVLRNDAGAPIGNGQASLLRRQRAGDAERGFAEETVDGVTLDGVLAERAPAHAVGRAALWVDVEGACGAVLPGARDTLAKAAVAIVEVEDRNDWGPEHWLREQVVGYLYDVGLVPVARDFEYPSQYNVVFVRTDLVADSTVRKLLARFTSRAVGPPDEPTFIERVERRVRARARAARPMRAPRPR